MRQKDIKVMVPIMILAVFVLFMGIWIPSMLSENDRATNITGTVYQNNSISEHDQINMTIFTFPLIAFFLVAGLVVFVVKKSFHH